GSCVSLILSHKSPEAVVRSFGDEREAVEVADFKTEAMQSAGRSLASDPIRRTSNLRLTGNSAIHLDDDGDGAVVSGHAGPPAESLDAKRRLCRPLDAQAIEEVRRALDRHGHRFGADQQ